jgi:hypothetical protein
VSLTTSTGWPRRRGRWRRSLRRNLVRSACTLTRKDGRGHHVTSTRAVDRHN